MAEAKAIDWIGKDAGALHAEVRPIATGDQLNEARGEWDDLLRQSDVIAGFFTDPVVLEKQLEFSRGDRLLLGRVQDKDQLVAIIPMICHRTAIGLTFGMVSIGRLPAYVARLPDFEFPRRRMCDPFAALASVVQACRNREWAPDLLLVDSVPGPLGGMVSHGLKVGGVQTSYFVRLDGDFEAYLHTMASRSRQKVKRAVRKFEEACGGQIRVVCYRAVEEMERLHQALTEVWQKSWHGRVGRQQVPQADYLKALAAHGWLRAYVLLAGDKTVASILGFQYKSTYYYEAPAYVQDWQEHSPGIVLLYSSLKDLFADDPPAKLDFGFGYGQYKEVFGTHEECRGMIRVGVSRRGRMINSLQSIFDRTFSSARNVLGRTGIPKLIKRRIRDGK